MTIADPLRETAIHYPDAPALVTPGRTLHYRTLDRVVTATAAHLRAIGVEPGMRVALYLPRRWQTVVLLMALLRAEAVACPISTRWPPPRVAEQVETLAAALLITDDHDVTAAMQDVMQGEIAVLTTSAVLLTGRSERRTATWPLDTEQPATIVFTSGSSGPPKAAQHTVGNHYFSAEGANENMPLARGDRWLLSLPLYHVGGLAILFRCWLAGAAVILAAEEMALPDALATHRITHASMVPTQLRRVLHAETLDAARDSLQGLLLGGGPLPETLLETAYAEGLPLHTTYGMTETSSQVTTTPPEASLQQLKTAGRVLPHRALTISPTREILVRGKTLFQGYVQGKTLHDPSDIDGWLHTGDLGMIDDAGYLHVTGRKDHQFVSGGENIQPETVEQALVQLDGIRRAVVVPVPDPEFGQRPVAFVDVADRMPPREQMVARLEAVLPRFMIPTHFYAWPDSVGEGQQMKVDRDQFQTEAYRRQSSTVSS